MVRPSPEFFEDRTPSIAMAPRMQGAGEPTSEGARAKSDSPRTLGAYNWNAARHGRHGWQTQSKQIVREDDAVELSTVYACLQVICQSMAMLPLRLLKRRKGGLGADPATSHRLSDVVMNCPNDEMTSFEWRMMCFFEQLLRGNSVSQVLRDGKGKATGIYPLYWLKTTVERVEDGGPLVYFYAGSSGSRNPEDRTPLPADQVLHFRGLSPNGLVGFSTVMTNREAVGEGMAQRDKAAQFTGNFDAPGGVVEMENEMSNEAYERLKESWNNARQGGQTPILEGGKYHSVGLTAKDSAYIEGRQFTRRELAAILRVPSHMINDLEDASLNNIEHMSIQFVTQTLAPHMANWEQRLNASLLTTSERRRGYYFDFDESALLRGDLKTLAEFYHAMRQDGVMNADEIRWKLGLNPQEGGTGEVYLTNGNMISVETAAAQQPKSDNNLPTEGGDE